MLHVSALLLSTDVCFELDGHESNASVSRRVRQCVPALTRHRSDGSVCLLHSGDQPMRMFLSVFFCLCAVCVADTLVVGSKTLDGVFEGFESRKFLFRTRDGKLARQDRSSVRSLTLDKPREVDLFLSASRKAETVLLLGYDKLTFSFKQDGSERNVSGMRVHKLDMEVPLFDDAAARQGQASGPIPPLDLSGVANGVSLTEGQRVSLAEYVSARKAYDAFLAESTSMVRQMDGATGAKRDDLLNRLRRRKSEEQQAMQGLRRAESALLAAFPNGIAPPPPPVGRPLPPRRGTSKLPDLGEDGVLLIDVSGLEKLPDLSQAQKTAVERYKSAVQRYEHLASQPMTADNQAEPDAVLGKVTTETKTALSALLEAFPGLRFE